MGFNFLDALPIVGGIRAADRAKDAAGEYSDAAKNAFLEYLSGLQAPTLAPVQSQVAGVYSDPKYAQKQDATLEYLSRLGTSGGMDPQAMLELQQAQDAMRSTEHAGAAAALDQAAQRGYGGGDTLGARLIANQGAENRAQSAGLQTAADARQRALEAMIAGGSMAGDVRGQGFGEATQRASAHDMIEQFNRQLQQQGFQNQANLANMKYAGKTGAAQAKVEGTNMVNQANAGVAQGLLGLGGSIAGMALGGAPAAAGASSVDAMPARKRAY